MTDWLTRLRPEPGAPLHPTGGPPADPSAITQLRDAAETLLAQVPTLVWPTLLAALTITTLLTLTTAKRRLRTAAATDRRDRRDTLLLVGALTPAIAFWGAVLIGSARGLTAFGRDDLRWTGGWEYLVPFTLDGVAISFGLLAFRAVRKARNPDRSVRVAWGAMLASAAINFSHEVGLRSASLLAGGYLALLSLLGMLIFDELLAQFEDDGTNEVRRSAPKFGLRWLTWPTNTACAWVAWRNHPPTQGTPATIAAAVAHLDEVRASKRARLAAHDTTPAWWALAPWLRIRRLQGLRAVELAAAARRDERHAEDLHALRTALQAMEAQLAEQRDASAERSAQAVEDLRQALAEERQRTSARYAEELHTVRREMERRVRDLRAEHAEVVSTLHAEHAREVSALRLEVTRLSSAVTSTAGQGRNGEAPQPRRSARGGRSARFADDTPALAEMFAAHPEGDYEWRPHEVNALTGAGWSGRAPRLVALATQHQRTCARDLHDRCFAPGGEPTSASGATSTSEATSTSGGSSTQDLETTRALV